MVGALVAQSLDPLLLQAVPTVGGDALGLPAVVLLLPLLDVHLLVDVVLLVEVVQHLVISPNRYWQFHFFVVASLLYHHASLVYLLLLLSLLLLVLLFEQMLQAVGPIVFGVGVVPPTALSVVLLS